MMDDDRRYWAAELSSGSFTAVPRASGATASAVAEHREPILSPAPTAAHLLAAHAVVLAALSGEREVTTGYVADGRARPLRLSTDTATWRGLLAHTASAQQRLQAAMDFPVEALAVELGRTGPLFEVELDPHDGAGELAAHTVLRVSLADGAIVVRYRTDVLDADAAARIGGYHRSALAQLAADPDATPTRQSLLAPEEFAFQIDGLAGPERELPDQRFHELFEQRAAAHPDAVAAEHAGRAWTYRELNQRANRIGRALRARGLRREGVVAVVTERNLDWMAAVLAIFKAGGVYLPIEPHFPAERIATTLARAGCALVLTEPGSDAQLRQAPADVPTLHVADACAEGHSAENLGVPVGPGQLAYIYFTSGSTGLPKGAMCEHAGMLNHLLAKIEDIGIREGGVVAQVAPQCFDISLWQLVSALLVGGRTMIVPQDVILDVERFVDEIATGRVEVLQVVPSYLEVIATYLERHPAHLPDLRAVSATGEALKLELIQRWLAVAPDVPLVNAYGLTETSDDTNHEIIREVPADGRVPLGRPVRNVRVYVVDEHLEPVPLGAPGLIAFSGVCVGRGYVNDPARTRQAYLADPHRPGKRLYLGGDYGRWLPDGKLEFLGRRDSQVKIRGFRIELGEIDNALLGVPGVRDAAVVVAEREHGKQLVAYYAAEHPIDADALGAALAATLPDYMVPSAFHWQERLPLTANGKIDTKALRASAIVDDAAAAEPPATPTEHTLAAAYATVLGVPVAEIGRQDHFFDRGGSSLTAVKLAIATGRVVSLKDITRTPVLAELAALVDGRLTAAS